MFTYIKLDLYDVKRNISTGDNIDYRLIRVHKIEIIENYMVISTRLIMLILKHINNY